MTERESRRDYLWRRAKEWQEILQSGECEDPAPLGLEVSWKLLDACYKKYANLDEWHYDLMPERADITGYGHDPLSALCNCLHSGFYPPPEILLALKEAFGEYMEAPKHGKQMTLEQAIFGKPVQKAGNFAKWQDNRRQHALQKLEFMSLLEEGLPRTQAAEIVSEHHGYKPDADTILRKFRGVTATNRRGNKT